MNCSSVTPMGGFLTVLSRFFCLVKDVVFALLGFLYYGPITHFPARRCSCSGLVNKTHEVYHP